ncbi:hypothetical protein L3X38_018159 [Prunus dulcis]|uniref:Uncharacterized protein n=1 Tax=Prunus dulcis TaxID=3755 RepID=A0AAD4Z9U5_PRUDU|nr:hypothetical protein L3X38_018159 [Prunus dulcis]
MWSWVLWENYVWLDPSRRVRRQSKRTESKILGAPLFLRTNRSPTLDQGVQGQGGGVSIIEITSVEEIMTALVLFQKEARVWWDTVVKSKDETQIDLVILPMEMESTWGSPLLASCWQCCLSILKKEGKYRQVKECGSSFSRATKRESNHKWRRLAFREKQGNPNGDAGPMLITLRDPRPVPFDSPRRPDQDLPVFPVGNHDLRPRARLVRAGAFSPSRRRLRRPNSVIEELSDRSLEVVVPVSPGDQGVQQSLERQLECNMHYLKYFPGFWIHYKHHQVKVRSHVA